MMVLYLKVPSDEGIQVVGGSEPPFTYIVEGLIYYDFIEGILQCVKVQVLQTPLLQ